MPQSTSIFGNKLKNNSIFSAARQVRCEFMREMGKKMRAEGIMFKESLDIPPKSGTGVDSLNKKLVQKNL